MSFEGRAGVVFGALFGCLVALANWSGDIGEAIALVLKATAIGFLIGYLVSKRRNKAK